AHPARQQHLAERVVDLVGAGVVQVLPLQVDRTTARLRFQPTRPVERRRPPDIVAQQHLELRPERRIAARCVPGRLQLDECRHQRLRHIAPAELAEPTGLYRCRAHPYRASFLCSAAAATNARMRSADFSPGSVSTPLLVSTTSGASASIARPTLPACSPPAPIRVACGG